MAKMFKKSLLKVYLFTTSRKSEITDPGFTVDACHLTSENSVPTSLFAIDWLELSWLDDNLIERSLTHDRSWWYFSLYEDVTVLFDVVIKQTLIFLFGRD